MGGQAVEEGKLLCLFIAHLALSCSLPTYLRQRQAVVLALGHLHHVLRLLRGQEGRSGGQGRGPGQRVRAEGQASSRQGFCEDASHARCVAATKRQLLVGF